MSKIKELAIKSKNTLIEDGITGLVKKGTKYIYFQGKKYTTKYDKGFKDILFINGCSLPHPERYRVDHQMEQLESYGIHCDKVYYDKLTMDMLRYYRGFVVYRCPIIPVVEEFIKEAKKNNKTVFYDIDDLVFDLEYTNQIRYLDTISEDEKKLYNDGVSRMGKTLDMCEYGIATTERLQKEMGKHLKEVYINRNVASEEMVKYSEVALNEVKKDDSRIVLAYLSGSITHNDDFKLIMPSVIKMLKKYDNVYLQVVGLLDLPEEMMDVKDKVLTSEFMDWKELPKLIRSIDVNLAPLEESIFNEAKSENKWTEAALVKIPTVASNVGAFKSQIEDKKTGLLCDTEKDWETNLSKLIEDREYREKIGNQAYEEVMAKHVTTKSGRGIADFIKSKLRKNVCFVVPSTNVSGGVMVAMKHGLILKKHGYDVTMININKATRKVSYLEENGEKILVVPTYRIEFLAYVDCLVATMWLTLEFVKKYPNVNYKKYLVQGMETNFYKPGEFEKKQANATYYKQVGIEYLTISKWCQNWLKSDFGVDALYAPNGIELGLFHKKERDFKGKIKILIEGNCEDYFKNVDESFKVTNKLDKDKYEIHYLSYQKEPKKWYQIDKFYHKVPHSEVGRIYEGCDILLKTSLLESFSYPPLEMMATGGVVVAVPNDGNVEYLKDEYNCLFYEQGNIDDGVNKINKIAQDEKLRKTLIENGYKTAKERKWENIEKNILELYK